MSDQIKWNCTSDELSDRFMALTSAVDVLRGAYGKDFPEDVLGYYRVAGEGKEIADSLYEFIRAIERHSVAIADHPDYCHAKEVK